MLFVQYFFLIGEISIKLVSRDYLFQIANATSIRLACCSLNDLHTITLFVYSVFAGK